MHGARAVRRVLLERDIPPADRARLLEREAYDLSVQYEEPHKRLQMLDEALDIRRSLGQSGDRLAASLINHGWALLAVGLYREAENRACEAIDAGPHPYLAVARHQLAEVYYVTERLREAADVAGEVLDSEDTQPTVKAATRRQRSLALAWLGETDAANAVLAPGFDEPENPSSLFLRDGIRFGLAVHMVLALAGEYEKVVQSLEAIRLQALYNPQDLTDYALTWVVCHQGQGNHREMQTWLPTLKRYAAQAYLDVQDTVRWQLRRLRITMPGKEGDI